MSSLKDWVLVAPEKILFIAISVALTYIALIVLTRISGIRSFSKMSGFDFAVTVAIGSIFASVIMAKSPSVLQGIAVLALLFACQIGFATLRAKVPTIISVTDNSPRLIMIGREIQTDQLEKAKMTKSDLYAKLREANVINLSEVKAVIAETTGDVSVLHGSDDTDISKVLLDGVIAGERYFLQKHGK